MKRTAILIISLLLMISLAAIIYFFDQNQDLRSRAVNDVENMLVTRAERKRGRVTQLGVILQNLDEDYRYRLTVRVTYKQNKHGRVFKHPRPLFKQKQFRIRENKTYKFWFRTPRCSWDPEVTVKLWYRENKRWKVVNAPTATGKTVLSLDCDSDTEDEQDAPPADPTAIDIDALPDEQPENEQITDDTNTGGTSEQTQATSTPTNTNTPTVTATPIPSLPPITTTAPTPTFTPTPTQTIATPTNTPIPTFTPTPTILAAITNTPTPTTDNGQLTTNTPTPTGAGGFGGLNNTTTPTPTSAGGGFGGLNTTATPTPTAIQQTSTPTSGTTNPADINGDGIVDLLDYTLLVSQFLETGANLSADLNDDGIVDLLDYTLLVAEFVNL